MYMRSWKRYLVVSISHLVAAAFKFMFNLKKKTVRMYNFRADKISDHAYGAYKIQNSLLLHAVEGCSQRTSWTSKTSASVLTVWSTKSSLWQQTFCGWSRWKWETNIVEKAEHILWCCSLEAQIQWWNKVINIGGNCVEKLILIFGTNILAEHTHSCSVSHSKRCKM